MKICKITDDFLAQFDCEPSGLEDAVKAKIKGLETELVDAQYARANTEKASADLKKENQDLRSHLDDLMEKGKDAKADAEAHKEAVLKEAILKAESAARKIIMEAASKGASIPDSQKASDEGDQEGEKPTMKAVIDEKKKTGLSHSDAMRAVIRDYPELYKEWREQTMSGKLALVRF